MPASALRALLAADRVTQVPGVWDPVTTALAVAAGHRAVHLSGTAVSATMLGRSDLDLVRATQIADRAATLAPALRDVPLLADADIGYGDPGYAVWTGLAYRRAGISGLQLADRAGPGGGARPADPAGPGGGPPAGSAVIGIGPAAAKIRALSEQVPDLLVIARTDAYPVKGLAETIVRCRAYAEAGAAAILPAGVPGIDELAAIHAAVPGVPIVLDRGEAAPNRPAWTEAELAAVGVRLVLHPLAALLAALRAASVTYRAIADGGDAEPVERMPWAALTTLLDRAASLGPDAGHIPPTLQT